MKKIIPIVLILLVLGAGYFYVQQNRAKNNLLQATGKTYKSLGILEVEIPKTEQKVTGWKSPSLSVPEVIVRVSFKGEKRTAHFRNTLLQADPLHPQIITLILPQLEKRERVEVEALRFDLHAQGHIERIDASSVTVKLADSNEGSLKMIKPELKLGLFEGTLPDQAVFQWDSAETVGGRPGHKTAFKKLEVGIQSKKQSSERAWTLLFNLEPFRAQDPKGEVEGKSIHVNLKGSLKELNPEARDQLFETTRAVFEKELKSFGDKKSSFEENQAAQRILQSVQNLLSTLKPMGEFSKIEIGEIKRTESGKTIFEFGPFQVEGRQKFSSSGRSSDGKGSLKRLQWFLPKGETLELSNVTFSGKSLYQLSSLDQFHQLIFAYIESLLDLQKKGGFPSSAKPDWSQLKRVYLAASSIYADEGETRLQAGRFFFQSSQGTIEHKNIKMIFKIEADRIGLSMGDDFDHDLKIPILGKIKNGKLETRITMLLPWSKFVKYAREVMLEEKKGKAVSQQIWNDFPAGYDFHFLVDLGKEEFQGELNYAVHANLAKLLKTAEGKWIWETSLASPPPDTAPADPLLASRRIESLYPQIFQKFFEEGKFLFEFKVERFAKFKALLEKLDPRSARNLLTAMPYFEVNAAKDAIQFKVELKEKQVFLNNQRNVLLEQMMQELKNR